MREPHVGVCCVIHAKAGDAPFHSIATGVGPTPRPQTSSGAPLAIPPSSANANVVPIVGCPAIGSSSPGVKMRSRM